MGYDQDDTLATLKMRALEETDLGVYRLSERKNTQYRGPYLGLRHLRNFIYFFWERYFWERVYKILINMKLENSVFLLNS